MPDIKTALATALNEWEQQAEDANKLGAIRAAQAVNPLTSEGTVIKAAAPATKTNLTRDTFAMVRDNPGISRAVAIERLQAMGHKPVSTSSILYQLVRAKMIDEGPFGTLSTKRKNYTPLQTKVRKIDKAKPQPKTVVAKAPAPSVAAPEPQATPIKAAHKVLEDSQRVSEEIDAWLNNVTLRYASLVYERLHHIFGAYK